MKIAEIGETKRVDLSELVLYSNPRKDLKDIKGLAATIVAAGGILQPLKGFYREITPGNFKYLIVDGQRRFTSLLLLEQMNEHAELLVNIPFAIMPEGMTESEIRAYQILSNEGEPLTPLELGESILEMIEGPEKLTISQVSESLGKSKVYVAELKKLGELPEYIKALIRKGTLSATLVREQMKAGTLDAFIANISENGIEGDGLPSDDITDDIEKGSNKKVTAKDLNKVNSLKEFKNFCKAFSEVFANNEAGQIKMKVYEFAKQLVNNELSADEILEYFTDEKTAQYDTPEKQALRKRANEQTGRTKKSGKGGAEASGGSDSALNDSHSTESEPGGQNAAEGAENEENDPLGFLAGIEESEPTPEQPETLTEPIEVAAPKKEKKAAAKKVAAKKVAEKAAPKKAAKKGEKTQPPKNTKRKIGYDKTKGQVAE